MDMMMLGQLTADLMEQTDEAFDDKDDAAVRTVMLLVEIDTAETTYFRVVCNDDRPWFQLAYLEEHRQKLLDLIDAMPSIPDVRSDDEDDD